MDVDGTAGTLRREHEELLATVEQLRHENAALAERVTAAEREASDARETAARARRTTSEFLANMSHEIRTPMNGVLGMLQLSMDTELSPTQRDYSQTALASAESLLGIINDILDFSEIDAGRVALHPRDFVLHDRVTETVLTLAHRGHDKGLEVTFDIAPDVPNRVHGDLGRLRQVLVNLIGNAIKFTEKGSVHLHVGVAERTDDSLLVHFQVRDTGIGVARDVQALIFEAFRQADGSTTRAFGGTGLGLAISASLVQRMGGTIWLESAEGAGSTFHFTARLEPAYRASPTGKPTPMWTPIISADPAAASPATGTAAGPAAEQTAAPSARNGTHRPLRVLVVEDNSVNQKLVTALCTNAGHTVSIAPNGRIGVDLAMKDEFDVILMDLQMPVLGGIEATQRIREWETRVGGHVPIIALTARDANGGRDACLAAGMDGYLSKPLRSAELFATIDALTAGSHVSTASLSPERTVDQDVFDQADLMKTLSGDTALMSELVQLFLDDAPKQMAAIRDGLARGDAAAVRFAAHALKGSSGTLTARRVSACARALEQVAAAGDLSDAPLLLGALESALAELGTRVATL